MRTVIPLLESGQTPEPGKIYRLVETFSDITVTNDPYTVSESTDAATGATVLNERKVGEGLMTLRGVFQRSDVKNANKRSYPRAIWEKWLREDSPLMTKVRSNQCCGQIEHPKDGVGILEDYAAMVTRLTLEKDGTVIGEMKVLDTPKGRIVRDLVRSGVRVGVSSRGTGSVDSNGVVDERTFKPETWDVVGNPSTPGAFPEVVDSGSGYRGGSAVSESKTSVRTLIEGGTTIWEVTDSKNQVVRRMTANVNIKHPGDFNMQPKDRFNEIRTHVGAHIASDVSESGIADLTKLDDALTEASISLGTIMQQDASLKSVGDDLQRQISEKRETIRTEIDERKKSGKVGEKCDDEEDDEEESDDEGDEESSDESVDPATVAEAIDCLKEARSTIVTLEEKVEAQEEAITTLAEQVAEREVELAEAYEQVAAATAMLAEMTSTPALNREPVEEAVEEAVTRHPLLSKHRKVLERCETVGEVQSLVESLVPRGTGSSPRLPGGSDLPPIGGNRDSLNEQTLPNTTRTTGYTRPGSANVPRGIALVESALRRQNGGVPAKSV